MKFTIKDQAQQDEPVELSVTTNTTGEALVYAKRGSLAALILKVTTDGKLRRTRDPGIRQLGFRTDASGALLFV